MRGCLAFEKSNEDENNAYLHEMTREI